MAYRNTTLNLPEELIAQAKSYAAVRGTTVTAIVRSHLEAVTRGQAPRPAEGALEELPRGLWGASTSSER